MRRLVYCIASTLDGFLAGPDGADPTGPDGFWPVADDYLKHLAAELPEILPVQARSALGITDEGTRFDTVLEGGAPTRSASGRVSPTPTPTCATSSSPGPWSSAPTRRWNWWPPTRWKRSAS